MRLSLEDQMALSALLGIPLADLTAKADAFIHKTNALVRREAETPRVAIVMMALAFLYHVKRYSKEEGGDLLEAAGRALLLAIQLLDVVLEDEE